LGPAWVKCSQTCFAGGGERQTVVLERHRDHTGGPAHSTSIEPISGVALVLLPFYLFSCAVVRLQRMTHWWRIVKLSVILSFSLHNPRSILTSPPVSIWRLDRKGQIIRHRHWYRC
jgi:hypothetical protein